MVRGRTRARLTGGGVESTVGSFANTLKTSNPVTSSSLLLATALSAAITSSWGTTELIRTSVT